MAAHYSLEELMTQYNLPRADADRILTISGSLKADIDAFMAAKTRREQASDWILDPYKKRPEAKQA
ncbi:hypothetical protein [Rhizobium sp.]|uniref:hypothetical protein n=1 Tax=Rhizobium sp. TaxID=391 RepID=UPI00289A8A08